MKATLFALFVSLLMLGCGESGDIEGVRRSEELIGGQIFIVTKSRENVKLGLVSVKVFDKEGIGKIRSEAEAILVQRLTKVDASSEWADFKEAWIDETISRVTPSARAKTDADGRFLFSPPSDKFMLAATSSRLTGDNQEEYRWLEVFQRDSIGLSGLLLSNDNLLNDLTGAAVLSPDARNRFDAIVARKRQEEERKRKDSVDNGKQVNAPKKGEQKVRLMQRQKSAKPTQTFAFRAQAISDIPVPALDIETRNLDPTIGVSPLGDVGDVSVNVDMSAINKTFTSNFMGIANKKDGLRTGWYRNGQKRWEGNYKNGKLNGPYSVWYENGQKKGEATIKDDKKDGPYSVWYENGQKEMERTYKDDKVLSAVAWKPNGEKCPVTKIDEDGNGVVVFYNNDGTEKRRETYKDGELVRD